MATVGTDPAAAGIGQLVFRQVRTLAAWADNAFLYCRGGVDVCHPAHVQPLQTWPDQPAKSPRYRALATAWEAAPDGLSYRFTLREGVKWHDGERFEVSVTTVKNHLIRAMTRCLLLVDS